MCGSAHCWEGCVYLLLGVPLRCLLQHNKQFETSAYTSLRVGCYLSKYALIERVCLPDAGRAAGVPREVVSPSAVSSER